MMKSAVISCWMGITFLYCGQVARAQTEWRLVTKIDCVAVPPPSEVGPTEIIQSPAGGYRQGGPRLGDRFVYPFELSAPDRTVRATIVYPDDKQRTAGVSVWGPPQEALGSGFMCGEDIPLSHQMIRREFVFFSRNQHAALVFSTEAANQPVAVTSIRIEELQSDLPPAPPAAISATDHRRIGLLWEDPIFARCFGEPDSVNADEFERVLSRAMQYSKWVGLTEINYPAYWYNWPMFDSRTTGGYPAPNRLHPTDAPARMARSCGEHGAAYVAVLNIFKLRTLMDHMLDEQRVIAGELNVNTVAADGRIVTWQNAQLWRDCVSIPLHPKVQDACKTLLAEVATQCAPYDSFTGVDLAMWPGTLVKLGSSASGDSSMSFDDYSVDAFCAEAKLTPPGKIGDKDRFAARAQWLRDDPARWNAWLKWRAERMTQYYADLATKLASIKPGAKLGICIYTGSGRPENENADLTAQFYAAGIDLDALSKNPNITIKRYAQQMLPRWRLRNGMPRPKNLNVENTAEFQKPFRNRPGMGFLVHQQYFETKVTADGGMLALPDPYPTESETLQTNGALRVIEPLPTGRDYLRFFAFAIRNFDPYSMCVGGYVLGTQGAEAELREMAMAFSALPKARFMKVCESRDLLVRRAVAEGRTWLYAVNLTPAPMSVAISIRDGRLVNAVTGVAMQALDGQVSIDLKPYELVSLCGDESLKIVGANQKPPR